MDETTNKVNQEVSIDGLAPWQACGAFNTYWTYNYSSKATFYATVNPRYYYFFTRYVQNWLYWYDGWVPYLHNQSNGVFSTRLATSLCNRLSDKVAGGQLMFKNSGVETQNGEINKALQFISTKWAKDADFARVRNLAIRYASAGGTALLKANVDGNGLWAEALRFDSFVPEVDFRGNVKKVTCYLQQYADLTKSTDGKTANNFFLIEERYFGDITRGNTTLRNRPLVRYRVKRATAVVGASNDVSQIYGEDIQFKNLPRTVRDSILKNYGILRFDIPHLLPFTDWLGVELVRWTENVSSIPQLPFGESLLAPIIAPLMVYDYAFSSTATDIYTGRARVLMPKPLINPKKNEKVAENGAQPNFNSGFDSFLYQQYPSSAVGAVNGEPEKPIPLQFDLRSTDWTQTRNMLVENIALNIGVNASTIASFLSDSSAKTATEVSVDENETVGYINNQRSILEKPFNRFLKHVTQYYGYADTVELRWSASGLTNRHSLANLIATAYSGGFLSEQKAVEMFNYDDDTAQIQEELMRIRQEKEAQNAQNFDMFGDMSQGLPQ